jgi:hypothetical protein
LGGAALQEYREGTLDSLGRSKSPNELTSSEDARRVAQIVLDAFRHQLAPHWSGILGTKVDAQSMRPCLAAIRVESPYEEDLSTDVSRVATSDAWIVRICDGPSRVVGLVSSRALVRLIGDDGRIVENPPVNSVQWDAWRPATPPIPAFSDAVQAVANASRRRVVTTARLVRSPYNVGYLGDWWMSIEAPVEMRDRQSGARVVASVLGWGLGQGRYHALHASTREPTARSADTLFRGDGSVSLILRRRSPHDGNAAEVLP